MFCLLPVLVWAVWKVLPQEWYCFQTKGKVNVAVLILFFGLKIKTDVTGFETLTQHIGVLNCCFILLRFWGFFFCSFTFESCFDVVFFFPQNGKTLSCPLSEVSYMNQFLACWFFVKVRVICRNFIIKKNVLHVSYSCMKLSCMIFIQQSECEEETVVCSEDEMANKTVSLDSTENIQFSKWIEKG